MNSVSPLSLTNLNNLNPKNADQLEKNLFNAKRLEYKDDKKAFDIYSKLAEAGISEAKYRCGVMLMEGRGTPPEFDKAFSDLSNMAEEGHNDAKNYLDKFQAKFLQRKAIALNFNELNKDFVMHAFEQTMPVKLQCAMVDFILAGKEGSEIESVFITHADLKAALDEIEVAVEERYFHDKTEQGMAQYQIAKDALLAYKSHVSERVTACLLQEGVNNYNQESQKKQGDEIQRKDIGIMPVAMPLDIWCCVGQHTSLINNIHLTEVSKSFSPLFNNEQVWKDSLSDAGIKHLRESEGKKSARDIFNEIELIGDEDEDGEREVISLRKEINIFLDKKGKKAWGGDVHSDSRLMQKVKNGELTLKEIDKKEKANFGEYAWEYSVNAKWRKARLIEGNFTFHQFESFPVDVKQALRTPEVQQWFEQNPKYIDQIPDLSRWTWLILKHPVLRAYIPPANVVTTTKADYIALITSGIFNWFTKNSETIGKESGLSPDAIDGLRNSRAWDCIKGKNNPSFELFDKAPAGYEAFKLLATGWGTGYVRGDPHYLGQVLCLPTVIAASAMHCFMLRECIENGSLSFERLAGATSYGLEIFTSHHRVINWLNGPENSRENRQHVGPVLCLSEEAATLLDDADTRDKIDKGILCFVEERDFFVIRPKNQES